jgi:CO dehydrogenase/acetyl-CoA synthase beta subunit
VPFLFLDFSSFFLIIVFKRKEADLMALKSIYISEELHRQVKLYAAEQGKKLKEVVEEFIATGLHQKWATAEHDLGIIEKPARMIKESTLVRIEAWPTTKEETSLEMLMREQERQATITRLKERALEYLGVPDGAVQVPTREEIRTLLARYQQASLRKGKLLSEMLEEMREE